MKPRRIFSALLLSLGLILLTFAATCRLVITNIQIDYDPSSPATITRSQFETFAYHAVNSPLPNENFTDLNALADTLRKALDEGTQIIL